MWRRYRYTIHTDAQPSVFLTPFTWHYYNHTLDVNKMHAAALTLRCDKPQDFSAFRKARSPASHSQITLQDISVRRESKYGRFVELEVRADWFVYGMMRLLAASLVQVGSGSLSVDQFSEIAKAGRRESIKFSAPPNGLCLLEVGYSDEVNPFIFEGVPTLRDVQHVTDSFVT